MSYQLVVFDMAGTTVYDDKFVHQVLGDSLKAYHVNVSLEEINQVMGWPKPTAISKLLHMAHGRMPETSLVEQIHGEFENNMVAFYRNDIRVKEKEGASALFAWLKKEGIRVALDTGFSRVIADTIIQRLGWDDSLIDVSVTSDEVQNGRPFPDMILKAMELTQVTDPLSVVKVGDTASDIQQGFKAGCGLVVGVTTGAYAADELAKYRPNHLISRLSELRSLLELSEAGPRS